MAELIILHEHKEFLLNQVARCLVSATILKRLLENSATADEYGFQPISVSREAVYQQIEKLPADEITKRRKKFFDDFDDCPLAHKKNRVEALSRQYYNSEDNREKREILRQIKDEIGEDLDKIAKALGQQTNNFNLGFYVFNGSSDASNRIIDANLEAIGGNGRAIPAEAVVLQDQDKLASVSSGSVLPPDSEESTAPF